MGQLGQVARHSHPDSLARTSQGHGPPSVRHFITALEGTCRPNPRQVRDIQLARARLDTLFSKRLFADPAWDMLLELYASDLEQRRVTVGTLCGTSRVPHTTALRWIGTLVRQGLIKRTADPFDGRRIYVSLSADASTKMDHWFATTGPELQVVR